MMEATQVPTLQALPTAERELTLNDRCDVCQAAAKVVATLINGELLFCGHHARSYGQRLIDTSLRVYDPEGVFNLIQ
jgi:hypothetical protein